jgi:HPt (histidine-containing phosphotransfer) domain-containing protein
VTDDAPLLDPAVLAELRQSVGDDDEFIADLVATYVAEGGDHLAAMEAAASAGDAGAIVRPAHTLKSSSAALGALRLAAMARDIELSGRAGDAWGLAQRVADARTAWDETLDALRATDLAT